MHDWTDTRGIRFGRKKKIEGRKDVLNDEYETSDNPRRSSSSVREAARRPLFHSIQDRTHISASLTTCVKMLREGDERAKTLLLLALLHIHKCKPMRVNMKEPVELEPMKKIDEIRRFSNKEIKLTKESLGALTKSSEYCGPIRKKSYSYISGIIGMPYNPLVNEDIRD